MLLLTYHSWNNCYPLSDYPQKVEKKDRGLEEGVAKDDRGQRQGRA